MAQGTHEAKRANNGVASTTSRGCRSALDVDEVRAWFSEAHRLFMEAEERLGDGSVLPALSSLAAVPPLHRMLVERCSGMLGTEDAEPTDEPAVPCGLYL
jgi:hypothetical protein